MTGPHRWYLIEASETTLYVGRVLATSPEAAREIAEADLNEHAGNGLIGFVAVEEHEITVTPR